MRKYLLLLIIFILPMAVKAERYQIELLDYNSYFEVWIKSTSHYPKLMLIHGERLFIKDGDQYKILAIQLAYEAFHANRK